MGENIVEFDSSLESTKTLYTISPNWGETLFFFWVLICFFFHHGHGSDGNRVGQNQRMVFILCLIPSLPYPAYWEKFSCPMHHCPLEPCEALSHLVKPYFLLIFPTTIAYIYIYIFFLMKPISLIKIYLKLELNLSHKIKLIFSKNWVQVFNKTISQQKEKSHSITHNKIIQTPNTWQNKNCLLLQQ